MVEIVEQLNFSKLKKIYKEETKRLVVFCGAGASREANLPNWNELVEDLLNWYLNLSATTSVSEKLSEELKNTIKYIPDN